MLRLCLLAAVWAQPPEEIRFSWAEQQLGYYHAGGEPAAPALVVLPSSPDTRQQEWTQWRQLIAPMKWTLLMPLFPFDSDAGVLNLERFTLDARRRFSLLQAPFYLLGAGPSTPAVFYAAARAPDLWAAALAISGSPKAAVDSDRLFAANTSNLPVGWAVTENDQQAAASFSQKLMAAGFNLKLLENPTVDQALRFLAAGRHNPFPEAIDCETGTPALARCYWIRMTEFDPQLRNDALGSSRVAPELQASLDLGGFGYQLSAPGPGVLVEWLPPNYKGPLRLQDRIVALSGTPLADARHYVELMRQVREEKPVAVMIQRGNERLRLTTRYQLPARREVLTARVKAHYAAEAKEIVIISRSVAALEITVPPQWVPAAINWNGSAVAAPENPGCYLVSLKTPGATRACSSTQSR